eukprot:GFUD01019880.1.p1 GENE.GFUD01019880.1~~GFUD01019880.1.p1  ORF type:complete len:1110 (+),score=249.46 GFUD01019880.1:78-3407(+)
MRSPSSKHKKLPMHSTDSITNPSPKSSLAGVEGDYVNHIKPSSRQDTIDQLDYYYGLVKRQLLRYQSPTSHLFPAKSSNTEQASIRDSIYSSAAVWSLYQAYRRLDDDRGKSYELGQSVVACMRGVLATWMRQSPKLEQWKSQHCPKLALHTVVGLHTGEEVLDYKQYNHLQMDVVCLYLLYLVQMITSGLEIIYSMEEVALIQNLVYYIERAYRTPDFGTWGRGTKYNDGNPEVSASAIGMAKAALEAVNGFNLFGERGSNYSVIYADIDAHNRNRSIFETLLPRESNTKNTDVSLLSTISYPAFATQNEELYNVTKARVVKYLKGEYGFKRFIMDGYGTEMEDNQRRYYQKGETLEFENVENEWPIFYILMIIDGVFKDIPDQVSEYQELLSNRMVYDQLSGDPLVPMMYAVPTDAMKKEKIKPKTQKRKITSSNLLGMPNDVFLWGQAMFIISELLTNNLLHMYELDPIKRYLPCYARPKPVGRYSSFLGMAPRGTAASDLVIQVVMIAESTRLQCMLANYGIQTQTPTEVEPVQIWPPSELVRVFQSMGKSSKLQLNGRPNRPIGSLGTSKLYRVCGKTVLCYPIIFSASEFYLSHDMALLTEDMRDELKFIGKYWRLVGRPTFCILISEQDMRDPQFSEMLKFLAELRHGHCEGVKVRLGRLQNLLSSSCIEHLDFLPGQDSSLEIQPIQELKHLYAGYQSLTDIPKILEIHEDLADFATQYQHTSSRDIVEILRSLQHVYGAIQLCGILLHREGPDFQVGELSVKEKLEHMNREAGHLRYWAALRYSSSLLKQLVDSISPYATQIIVNGKTLTVGTVGVVFEEFDKPCAPQEIHKALYTKVQPYNIIGAVLQQELILYCGKIIASKPEMFDGILCLRMSRIIQAIEMYLGFTNPKETSHIENLAPSKIREILVSVLEVTGLNDDPKKTRNLSSHQINSLNGCLLRVPCNFFPSVFHILERCPGGLTFLNRHLPQQPTIETMDPKELSFFHMVEGFFAQYSVPDYLFLMVRVLTILSTVLKRNPELTFSKELKMDDLIKDSVKIFLKDHKLLQEVDLSQFSEHMDLDRFLTLDQAVLDSYIARAIVNLLLVGEIGQMGMECKLQ